MNKFSPSYGIQKISGVKLDENFSELSQSFALPEWYGAKSDGSVDSTQAINKCINENPGKTIRLGSGIYLVSSINLSNHAVELVGSGKYNTVLKCISSVNAVIYKNNTTIYIGYRISNLTIDCNNLSNIGIKLESCNSNPKPSSV